MWNPPKSQYVKEDNFVTSIFLFTFKTLLLTSLGTNSGHIKQAIEQCWVSSTSLCSLWEAPTGIFAIHSTPEWFISTLMWLPSLNKFRSKNPCAISMICNPSSPPTPASLPVLVTLRTWCGLMVGVGGHSLWERRKCGEEPDQVSKKRGSSLAEVHTDDEHLCREWLWKQLNKA